MPACTIVQIVCASCHGKFRSVGRDGSLQLDSQAQLCGCHSKQGVECVVLQHLQSGAFVEQAPDRKLRLCFDPALATVFAKLCAYSQGGLSDDKRVWLRAATGGLVCPVEEGKLAVTVNATRDEDPDHWCSFILQAVDTEGLLAKDSPQMLIYGQSDKLSHKALDFKSEPASVSIGAKPVSSFAIHRSSAVPIALKRPIRKVSFGDMSDFESSTSGIKSVPQLNATSPFRSSSSASPRSYTLRDAVYNRVPASPAYSQHSEVADSEDSKVRGGRLYESDCNSSSASLSSHTSREDIQASSSTGTHSQHQARPLHSSPPEPTATSSADAKPKPNAAACLPDLHKLHIESQPAQGDTVSSSKSGNQENSLRGSSSMDAFSNNGHKTHGGNLFGSQGPADMRSTKSSSDLQGIQSSSAMSGPTKGPSKSRPCLQRNSLPLYCSGYSHKTHGSNDALNALASSPSPSSHQLHPLSHLSNPSSQTQLPRATASPSSTPLSDPEDSDDSSLQFPSSAPLPSWGVMDPQDSDHSWHQHFAQARSYHHSGHSIHSSMPSSRQGHHDSDLPSGERDRGMYGSPISPLGSKWPASRQLPEAAFASPRCSGEYQREPSMPCILEGGPAAAIPTSQMASQSHSVDIQDLLSKAGQTQHAQVPQAAGVKRVASSPVLPEAIPPPAIHKVVPRGSPGLFTSPSWHAPPEWLHTGSQGNTQDQSRQNQSSRSLTDLEKANERVASVQPSSSVQKVMC